MVADKGSANGTTLRGRGLPSGVMAPIANGDALVLGGVVSIRPYFDPAALQEFLQTVQVIRRSERRLGPETLGLYERLAREFSSLGLQVDLREASRELILETFEGNKVRLVRDGAMYAVEWGTGNVFLQRKTVAVSEPKVEDTIRQLVNDAMMPSSKTDMAPTQPNLEETQSDDAPSKFPTRRS
jgi:hypothetical protein